MSVRSTQKNVFAFPLVDMIYVDFCAHFTEYLRGYEHLKVGVEPEVEYSCGTFDQIWLHSLIVTTPT